MKNLLLNIIVSISLVLTVATGRLGGQRETIAQRKLQDQNIVQVAVGAAPEFTTLVDIVTQLGLVDALSGDGPFTVFAPTNSAFESLLSSLPEEGDASLENLIATGALEDIVKYHVVPGTAIESSFLLDGAVVETLSGDSITVNFDAASSGFQINDSSIVSADILASNGIIHAIDKVLLPGSASGEEGQEPKEPSEPTKTIVEIATEQFPTLASLITTLGLDAELTKKNKEFTVFAPTEAAFESFLANLPTGGLELITSNGVLEEIVKFHVIGEPLLSSDFVPYIEIETVQGDTIKETRGSPIILNYGTEVETADILATNGVLHSVKKVLIPRSFPISKNVVELLINEEDVSDLKDLVLFLNLVQTLISEGPFTIFAPTNKAFQDFRDTLPDEGEGSFSDLLKSGVVLDVVLNHVVQGDAILSSTLESGASVSTLGGGELTVSIADDGTVKIGDGIVTKADVLGVNGVIHFVDQILLP